MKPHTVLKTCITKNISMIPVIFLITVFLYPISSHAYPEQVNSMQEFVINNNAFAVTLYKKIASPTENVFVSPYSISTALAMVYVGAQGKTKDQISAVLNYSQNHSVHSKQFQSMKLFLDSIVSDQTIQLTNANSMWIQDEYPILPVYKKQLNDFFYAAIENVNFEESEKVRNTINSWIENNTNKRIKDMIQPGVINSLTRVVLANAIFFKANWVKQFDKKATETLPFYTSPKKSKQVSFMRKEDRFLFKQDKDSKMLVLPYDQEKLSMILLLPKTIEGIKAVEHSHLNTNFNSEISECEYKKVSIAIPVFTFTTFYELNAILKSMGITDAFSSKNADFSLINPDKTLYISDVLHKAFIDVNEQGTEAAAATVIAMRTYSAAPEQETAEEFIADHPFVFIIRENTYGTILFMGRCSNP